MSVALHTAQHVPSSTSESTHEQHFKSSHTFTHHVSEQLTHTTQIHTAA